ncbi:MAG: MerR family transcriptional regulator [Methylocella sp.]
MDKSADAFRTISEVAEDLDLPQHVLRFWETRFPQIKPLKRAGGRRFYRPHDVEILRAIKRLLYGEGYTIKGVQRILREQGARAVIAPEVAASANGPGFAAEAPPAFADADGPAGWAQDLFAQKSSSPSDDPDFAVERAGPTTSGLASGEDAPGIAEAAEDGMAARAQMIRRLKDILSELEACRRMLEAARRP